MKRILVWALPFLMSSVCQAEDITIRYNGSTVKVDQKEKDSVTVTVKGANVNIDSKYTAHKLSVRLTGKSEDGQLILKTAGKAKVTLDKLNLTSQEGAPIDLKNKKKVEVAVADGTENTLTITACNDTANHKAAVIWAKDKLLLSGKGTLNIVATGDGCRGIKTKDDITIEDLTLNVTTSGNHLGEKPFSFGGFGGFGGGEMPDFGNFQMPEGGFQMPEGGFPNFGGGFPGFGGMRPEGNDSTRQGGFPNFGGGFPGFGGMRPEGNDSTRRGGFPNFGEGFPNFGEGGMPDFGGFGGGFGGFGNPGEEGEEDEEGGGMGFGGKRKYVASTKGIASKGKIIINSGKVTVKTSTAGAEGIEGKEGVVVNGGLVDVMSPDDAINANATIEFNGGTVIARSRGNDAVDSNPKGGFFMPFGGNNNQEDTDPAIIITGGTVYAWSQAGSPEEGLDCDFAPLVIEGGTIFTVGGGMGEMPSVPTNYTSKQPSALLIGINIVKEEPVYLYDSKNKLLETITVPFSLRRSASLVSSAAFQVGETYTVKTKGYEKTFTLNENFTAVR
ncbi:MAG: carbohydrate-binding domain-containing protein [Bacteroidaceae bacterium]|nr:carbohydrate-binding domain-containing protein [Bacteroidaceae bacterium]